MYTDFHTLLGHQLEHLEPQAELKNQISWAELSKVGLYKSRGARWPLETKFYTVTPNISGSAKRNLPEVTIIAPIVLRWVPDF